MPEPSAGHQMFEAASYIAGVVLGIWLIVAGSGAAGGRAWGLTMLRGWAVIRIIVAIIVLVGFFYWLDEVVAASQLMHNAGAGGPSNCCREVMQLTCPPSPRARLQCDLTIGWYLSSDCSRQHLATYRVDHDPSPGRGLTL